MNKMDMKEEKGKGGILYRCSVCGCENIEWDFAMDTVVVEDIVCRKCEEDQDEEEASDDEPA